MEILAELLLGLLQIVGEMALEVFLQVLVEMGMHAVIEPFSRAKPRPWLAAIGYLIFGALIGLASTIFFPASFINSATGRVINLVASPIVAGFCMAAVGAWRERRGQNLLSMDHFLYGFLFALALSGTRFVLTR